MEKGLQILGKDQRMTSMSAASVFHSPAAGSKAIVSTLPTGTIRAKPKCGGKLGPTFATVRWSR